MKNAMMLILGLTLYANAFASGGHYHPVQIVRCAGECTADQIKGAALKGVPHLNKWGKIDAAWSNATVVSAEKKQFKKGPEWMVTLVDSAKQKRYIFVTLDGFVTGSNSTGE